MSRLKSFGLAAMAVTSLLATGCEERAPRSFVQPNVIKKTDLQGIWHYIQTVTDAPPSQAENFPGLSSELMKIKFDVQENQLFARRSYEWIVNSEDKALTEQQKKEYEGEPLAGWNIASQFDIIRDYNPTTGEETNRIIESTERPWNEREFIRVNWADNIVPNASALFWDFNGTDDIVQSASYWESDPNHPDAFHMERATKAQADADGEFAAGEANYLDITNKLAIKYGNTTFHWGDESVNVSHCLLANYGMPNTEDCSSQIIKVRHAFAKRSPSHDYEPRQWDGIQMDMFGIWDVGLRRFSYDRQYGITNTGFIRHAARFNLWKKSYQADGKTLIPYADRQLRTTPYYASSTSGEFPANLFDSGKEVVRQWNEAIKVAVKDLTGAMPSQDVFVWCHNPVKVSEDPAACAAGLMPEINAAGEEVKDAAGNPILRARQGDPRRSHIFWVNQNQNAGPLGYGPPIFDPESGETISGQAYIYGGGIDSYAARARDLVLLLAGRIDPTAYITGLNVSEWVNQNRAGAGASGQKSTFQAQEVSDYYKSMDFGFAAGLASESRIDRSSPQSFKASWRERASSLYNTGLFGDSQVDLGQIRMNKLRGSEIEARLITPEVYTAAGMPPNTDWNSLSEDQRTRISPLRSNALRKAINERRAKMNSLGVDFADFADEGIAQRAAKLATDPNVANMDPQAIYDSLRKDIFLGVTLHEMGHNVGLRHNFRGSYDALNYFPQYWELRDQGKRSTKRYTGWDIANNRPTGVNYAGGALCTAPNPNAGKLRPRYIDCPGGATSVEEVAGGVREYQYSSIMDYGSDFNSDLHGLGHYDLAAMKFSYAKHVEVYTKLKSDRTSQNTFTSLQYSAGWGLASPLYLFSDRPFGSVNYTTFPDLFQDGFQGMEERMDVPYESLVNEGSLRVDSVNGLPMVPYQFCSDEFAGNMTCQRFDSGADVYEQAEDLISRYNNYYILNNFKRDRYTFSNNGYMDRIADRYLDKLRAQMTWFTLLRSEWADIDQIDDFFQDENGWGGFTVAVGESMNLLGRIISTPQAGSYELVSAANSTDFPFEVWRQNGDSLSPSDMPLSNEIGLIDGKFVDTTWDFDACGYYWADECQSRIGYFYDKVLALLTLADSQAYFTGRDTSTDVRKYAIGYIVPFKHQMQEKIGAMLAGDFRSLAPNFTDTAHSKVSLPNWALNNASETPRTNLVDPAGGFTLQLYAGLLGLAYFPTTFDNSFIDTTRIFVVGNGEAPIPDAQLIADSTTDPAQTKGAGGAFAWLRWTDPESGKTYAAHSIPKVADGGQFTASYRNDTGVRMLSMAKQLADSAGTPAQKLAFAKYKQNLDIMRSLHHEFGYSPFIQ